MSTGLNCQRCKGQMMPDIEGDFYCIQCGNVVYGHLLEVGEKKPK